MENVVDQVSDTPTLRANISFRANRPTFAVLRDKRSSFTGGVAVMTQLSPMPLS